jgi:hypothetical protein
MVMASRRLLWRRILRERTRICSVPMDLSQNAGFQLSRLYSSAGVLRSVLRKIICALSIVTVYICSSCVTTRRWIELTPVYYHGVANYLNNGAPHKAMAICLSNGNITMISGDETVNLAQIAVVDACSTGIAGEQRFPTCNDCQLVYVDGEQMFDPVKYYEIKKEQALNAVAQEQAENTAMLGALTELGVAAGATGASLALHKPVPVYSPAVPVVVSPASSYPTNPTLLSDSSGSPTLVPPGSGLVACAPGQIPIQQIWPQRGQPGFGSGPVNLCNPSSVAPSAGSPDAGPTISVGTMPSGGTSDQYDATPYDRCITSFWDPNLYMWMSYKNNCPNVLVVSFVTNDNSSSGSTDDLQPGGSDNTGMSQSYINSHGGVSRAVCRSGYLPVDDNGHLWLRAGSPYRCKLSF